ncbi:hypothetical protein F0562_004312 [Nyssa sinensis]|uniref:tRNA (guanine(26)-N(2))-dimethyltransferase n=1 Tax=Nyssa sinensis TaxID=561372 RepID=A0A5J5BXH4_9ASTE|nr:hypothetical protein F0562_004312 [Nyssa sinensis]
MSSSSSPLTKPDVTLSLTLPSPSPVEALKPEERGIKLIQLLLKCANHASSGNLHRADACLRQISQLASVSGDSMQRLASWFASALAVRLVKRWPGLYKALNHSGPASAELDQARSIFTRAFPYLGFAYAVITRSLIQTMSASSERVIHIIDLGSGDPKLWVPLLRSFAHVLHGPRHLKITCVSSKRVVLEKLGARLAKEAQSLDMAFQFNPVNVTLRELTIDMLKVRSGEALALTSVLNLHILLAEDDRVDAHFGFSSKNNNGVKDCKQMSKFLAMVQSMSPKVVLLVEQESDHNLNRLADRFIEGLHYYSAVFDSIDVNFRGSSSEERVALEEMFGKEIENMVACEGLEREERHERYARWMVRFAGAGFRPVRLFYESMEDARRLVEAYGSDGKLQEGEADHFSLKTFSNVRHRRNNLGPCRHHHQEKQKRKLERPSDLLLTDMGIDNKTREEEKQTSETMSSDLNNYTIIKEGEAEILMHAKNQVFYNKTQVKNRDISIAVLRAFISKRKQEQEAILSRRMKTAQLVMGENASKLEAPAESAPHDEKSNGKCEELEEISHDEPCCISEETVKTSDGKGQGELKAPRVLEALSASGLRALRYAREVEGIGQVVALDNDKASVEACRRNIKFNGSVACSKVESHLADARVYMLSHPKEFDVVDLDPYGSPSVFLDSAVQSIVDGGMLMCTATDMAVLCGGNGEVCYSKYGSYPLRGKYCHEMALRILLASIESHANRYKRYIVPVLSVQMDFYVRVFVRIYTSASAMKNTPLKLSYVYQCTGCDSFHLQSIGRTVSKNNSVRYLPGFGPVVPQECSDCGKKYNMGGPIWSAPIHDQEWVTSILADVKSMN